MNQQAELDLKVVRRWLITALCISTTIKFCLALFTFGTNDVASWAVPFVLALGFGWAVTYYVSVGSLLFALYNYWSNGGWYYAESHLQPSWDRGSSITAFVCWGVIALMLIRYKNLLQRSEEKTLAQ